MSERPEGIPAAEPPTPRDSAAGVVLRPDPDGRLRVLLGRRAHRSRFMPGHLAFPGGVVDAVDRGAGDVFARCVSREFAEEAALFIPPGDWIAAGTRVTPPMFPVRFDNRFFVATAPAGWNVPEALPSPEEIEHLEFMDPREVLRDWAGGRVRLPPPVMPLLRCLAEHATAAVDDLAAQLASINRLEQRAPRIEFCPDVWMVPVRTATLPPATHTNVWLPGRGKFVVIDPGCSEPGEQAMLLEVIERRRAAGGTPVAVLLTHGHIDHVAGARDIARSLGLPLRAHPTVLDGLGKPEGATEFRPIEDGETLDLDGLELVARLTPGHAPGHLLFHIPARAAAIAGDLLSGTSTILIDPGHGDMGDYLASLELLRGLDCKLLFPGHGPPMPGKALDELIQHRRGREARIQAQLSGDPRELSAIARVAYSEIPQLPALLIERQTLSHLLLLERNGRAQRSATDGSAWVECTTAGRIERILRERLDPIYFELRDESHKHAGHAGAASGGGHYRVKIVAAAFEGQPLLERHRSINEALRELFGRQIHALALRTLAPSEWTPPAETS